MRGKIFRGLLDNQRLAVLTGGEYRRLLSFADFFARDGKHYWSCSAVQSRMSNNVAITLANGLFVTLPIEGLMARALLILHSVAEVVTLLAILEVFYGS